jgi:hypothetical protein
MTPCVVETTLAEWMLYLTNQIGAEIGSVFLVEIQCVCPEPVLVNRRFSCEIDNKNGWLVFLQARSTKPSATTVLLFLTTRRACRKQCCVMRRALRSVALLLFVPSRSSWQIFF